MSFNSALVVLFDVYFGLFLNDRPLIIGKDISLLVGSQIDCIIGHCQEEQTLRGHPLMIDHFIVLRLWEG